MARLTWLFAALPLKSFADAAQKPSATIKPMKREIARNPGHNDPKERAAYGLKLSIGPTVSFEA